MRERAVSRSWCRVLRSGSSPSYRAARTRRSGRANSLAKQVMRSRASASVSPTSPSKAQTAGTIDWRSRHTNERASSAVGVGAPSRERLRRSWRPKRPERCSSSAANAVCAASSRFCRSRRNPRLWHALPWPFSQASSHNSSALPTLPARIASLAASWSDFASRHEQSPRRSSITSAPSTCERPVKRARRRVSRAARAPS
jgi:hypothetical protein